MLCATYDLTLAQIDALTPAQTDYLLEHMPEVEYRRAYPLASLEAAVLNAIGGKPDPEDKDAEPLPPERTFTPLEILPPYARPAWIAERTPAGLPPAVAHDFMQRVKTKLLPPWVLAICPIDHIRAAAA